LRARDLPGRNAAAVTGDGAIVGADATSDGVNTAPETIATRLVDTGLPPASAAPGTAVSPPGTNQLA
jgi:hypothetical protein